ncbi:MAG: DUF1853 family protein [Pseudomonadales bacterium]
MHVLTTVENQLQQLKDPQVRDLAWACFSQALCALERPIYAPSQSSSTLQSMFEPTLARLQWLTELDAKPTALHTHLENRPSRRRLGIYFEHLVEFFLLKDPLLQLACRNVPVRNGANTLGEFDLLYFDRSAPQQEELIHLEVAVKFYLGLPAHMNNDPTRLWRGPGSQDALEDKLAKLVHHQSRLAEKPQSEQALAKEGIGLPTRQRIVVAGELFQAVDDMVAAPPECSVLHHSASWLRLESAPGYFANWHDLVLLDKSQWLTPLADGFLKRHGLNSESLLAQLQEHFTHSEFPVMVEGIGNDGQDRVFIVPRSWPLAGLSF